MNRVAGLLFGLLLLGCQQEMADQPRYDPYEPSGVFADGAADRPLVAGVVPRGYVLDGTGVQPIGAITPGPGYPVTLDAAALARGRERFGIYCAPCHGLAGSGDGVITRHGYPQPPSYHEARLRNKPPAHFVYVIEHGWGAMYPYANRVSPEDRWRIAAYIKALQLSRHPAGVAGLGRGGQP